METCGSKNCNGEIIDCLMGHATLSPDGVGLTNEDGSLIAYGSRKGFTPIHPCADGLKHEGLKYEVIFKHQLNSQSTCVRCGEVITAA